MDSEAFAAFNDYYNLLLTTLNGVLDVFWVSEMVAQCHQSPLSSQQITLLIQLTVLKQTPMLNRSAAMIHAAKCREFLPLLNLAAYFSQK